VSNYMTLFSEIPGDPTNREFWPFSRRKRVLEPQADGGEPEDVEHPALGAGQARQWTPDWPGFGGGRRWRGAGIAIPAALR
jgi:hypothetical protein